MGPSGIGRVMEGMRAVEISKSPKQYLIKVEAGTEVIAALADFVKQNKIGSGSLIGLGAIKDTTIGWFHSDTKKYTKLAFPEEIEIVGATGTIAWLGNDPSIHMHVVLGAEDGKTFAGHLFSAVVAVTVEFVLTASPVRVERKQDPRFGLNLLDI